MYKTLQLSLSATLLTSVFYCWSMDDKKVSPSVLEKVYASNLEKNRDFKERKHEPLLVLLSGCAGMGKSTVAKGLQEQTGMLIFDAYHSREVMRDANCFHVSMPSDKKVAKFLACFSYFVEKVHRKLPNKAIIFDESIDRQKPSIYTLVSKIAQKHTAPTFLVRLEVPKQIAFDRLMQREKNSEENRAHFKKHFDSYYKVYETFGDTIKNKFDYTQNNKHDDPEKCVDKELVQKIKQGIEYKSEN